MIEGRHVKVLGSGCDPAKLGNVGHVVETVQRLVEACGMRVLGLHPYDVAIEIEKLRAKPFEDEGGITVVGVLSTSHCSIHTWPARGFFVIDVYSCRTFEAGPVVDILIDAFDRAHASKAAKRIPFVDAPVLKDMGPHGHAELVALWKEDAETTRAGSALLRVTDLSHALEMPEHWRDPAPEYAQ